MKGVKRSESEMREFLAKADKLRDTGLSYREAAKKLGTPVTSLYEIRSKLSKQKRPYTRRKTPQLVKYIAPPQSSFLSADRATILSTIISQVETTKQLLALLKE